MSTYLLDMHARELVKMPENWEGYSWRVLGYPDRKLYEIKGCFTPPAITRGPRKGAPNWAKRDRSTERIVHIPFAEHEAWVEQWVERTGLCRKCLGRGEEVASVSVARTTYRQCRECLGSGKAQGQAQAAEVEG